MSEISVLIDRVEEITGHRINSSHIKIHTDTSEWMNIVQGDIIQLENNNYFIRGNATESRFGIGDQPKYWVFNCFDLSNGDEKIIKTEFDEEFISHIGNLQIRCYRNPEKEGKVLQETFGDYRFMQGKAMFDEKNNNVRVIDYIKGINYFNYIPAIPKSHEDYFREDLPIILRNLKDLIEAIALLHKKNLCHGDIRNDHIIIDSNSGLYRWIDFDLKQDVLDFDVWSLGNILSYTVGKGIITFNSLIKKENFKNILTREDCSAFYEYRVINLKKVFDYIGPKLENILKRFSLKLNNFYENIDEFQVEYNNMLESEFN